MTDLRLFQSAHSWLCIGLVGCCSFGCLTEPDESWMKEYKSGAPLVTKDTFLVKLSVFNDRVLLDGKVSSLDQVKAALQKCRERKGVLWWYKQARHENDRPRSTIAQETAELVIACMRAGPEFRLSGKPDFSDLIEEQRELRSLIKRLHDEETGTK